ncbi:MAG: polyprenol monophosphomannose synthase [Caldilineaceae bacterium]
MSEPSRSKKTLAIVPTYNERENISRMVMALRALAEGVDVLVVDDGSPDGTGALVDMLAASDEGIHVLHRAAKLGLGTAYKAGFAFGLANAYEYICTMDADFSHDPSALPSLLDAASAGADLVVGSRYVPGGKVIGWPRFRTIISAVANRLAHVFLGVDTHDCTAGFRCYRRALLETIDLDSIFSTGYSFLIEMTFLCQQKGFRIVEVPITFVNRTQGASKISKVEIVKAFYTMIRLRTSALPWDKMMGIVHNRRDRRLHRKQSDNVEV